jgi:hypothetical protein
MALMNRRGRWNDLRVQRDGVAFVFHMMMRYFISFIQVLFRNQHFHLVLVPHRNAFHEFARYNLKS